MEKLKKKYGLFTAIAMVVGVVIGSGVFFKADDVLKLTDGNLILALVAWLVGALAMIFGALVFSEFAQRIEKSNGVVDYFEAAYGKRFGYLVGWFNGILYFSPLSAILAWVAALYTMILLGAENPTNSIMTWSLALIFMLFTYILNYYAPILAGRFQVGTTLIKLVPLSLVAIVGMIHGLTSGVTMENFTHAAQTIGSDKGGLAAAIVATAFAYEGWVIAITINDEIKDSKKNLPRALVFGTAVIFLVYIFYFLGIAGVLPTSAIVNEGDNAVRLATTGLFGNTASVVLTAFVVISCLGTLNGLVMSCIRNPFSLAVRNQGPMPKLIAKVNAKTNMPFYASVYALILSVGYLGLWYMSLNDLLGRYIAIDEIPIVMIYGLYLILYVWYMRNFKDLNIYKRFIVPSLASIGSCIILYGGMKNPSIGIYLIISVVVLLLGLVFYREDRNVED